MAQCTQYRVIWEHLRDHFRDSGIRKPNEEGKQYIGFAQIVFPLECA